MSTHLRRGIALGCCAAALAAIAHAQTPVALPLAGFKSESFTLGEIHVSTEAPLKESPAEVSRAANRLTFLEPEVHVVVECRGGPDDLYFSIGGLKNPELVFNQGSEVTFDIVNLAVFYNPMTFMPTDKRPPYLGQPRGWQWDSFPRFAGRAKLRPLPGRTGNTVYDVILKCRFETPGRAYYVGAYTGYAQAGKWGRILVVP